MKRFLEHRNFKQWVRNLRDVFFLLSFLVAIVFVGVFTTRFTFGFTPLLLVLLLFILIIALSKKDYINGPTPGKTFKISIVFILTFGALCLFSLNNYINPPREVFANNDHHVLAVEGLHFRDSRGVILAADAKKAVFDNHLFSGELILANSPEEPCADDTGKCVTNIPFLQKSFPIPIYQKKTERYYRFPWLKVGLPILSYRYDCFEDIDADSPEVFHQGETVELSQGTRHISLKVEELADTLACRYTLSYKMGALDTTIVSPFKSFLRKSYPLSLLFRDVEIPGFSMEGIVLCRTKYFDLKIDRDKIRSGYKNSYYRLAFLSTASRNTRVQIDNDYAYSPFSGQRKGTFVADGKTVYALGANEDWASQFRFFPEASGFSLRYRMPMYRYLFTDKKEGEREHYFMIASTLMMPDSTVNQQVSENILLYECFEKKDNIYQMRPGFLSFVSGETNDPLVCALHAADGRVSQTGLRAGTDWPEMPTLTDNATWILSLDNLKDPSLKRPVGIGGPMSPRTMALILIGVTLLAILLLKKRAFSPIEPIAYMILLAFLTIRLFLLWRISVFSPVFSVTPTELNGIFKNPSHLSWFSLSAIWWIVFLLIAMFVTVFIVKSVRRKPISLPEEDEESLKKRFIWHLTIIVLGSIGGAIVVFLGHITSRMICVLLPLVVFFISDFSANTHFGGLYDKKSVIDFRYLWLLAANSIFIGFYCFVADGGFGIIFAYFSLFNIVLRLIDAYVYRKKHEPDGDVLITRWVYLLSLGIIFLAIFSKNIVVLLLSGPVFSIVLFFILLFFLITIFLTFNKIRIENGRLFLAPDVRKHFLAAFVAVIVVSVLSIWAPTFFGGKHTEYRLMVQAMSPDEAIGHLKSDLGERKFMEASINDWILGEYNQIGDAVTPGLGEKGNGYFKIQPHSKVGALWGAQATDISIARFVTAEHGKGLTILLLMALGCFLLVCISFVSRTVRSKALVTQIPLLFAVQALIVWMTVTQRFVFLGQDFPMISITSNLTSITFIVGLTVVICVSARETTRIRPPMRLWGDWFESQKRNYRESITRIRGKNHALAIHTSIISIFLITAMLVLGNQRRSHFYHNGSESRYDPRGGLIALDSCMVALNKDYEKFQRDRKLALSTQPPQSCLREYCKDRHYVQDIADKSDTISQFLSSNPAYADFCKMVFSRYLNKGENDADGLMFSVKKKWRESESSVTHFVYQLRVNEAYYRRDLPRPIRDAWRGSIVAATSYDTQQPPVSSSRDYTIYTIPPRITGAGKALTVLRAEARNVIVVGRDAPQQLSQGQSYILMEQDNVLVDGRLVDMSRYGMASYLARNVIVNGSPTFIYPMQECLFWLRPFAELLMRDKKTSDISSENQFENVPLTLSSTLTRTLYRHIEKARPAKQTAAIVADGDGNIVAMIDQKLPSFRINPNDSKRIADIERELRLEGEYVWGKKAENYFANKALINLRFGPGSSQKPLTWTAVTTQYNKSAFWHDLQFAPINQHLFYTVDNGHYSTRYIAGNRVSPGGQGRFFQSIKTDEGLVYGSKPRTTAVDLSFYLYKSSNYYNAMMVLFGTYSKNQLDQQFSNDRLVVKSDGPLLRPVPERLLTLKNANAKDLDDYQKSFPIMQLANRSPFAFCSLPDYETLLNAENSLLVKGLREGFALPSRDGKGNHPVIYPFTNERLGQISGFAIPQVSYFSNKERMAADKRGRADFAIRSTALGASNVWQVSPLMMAQMYGKLISLNANYTLHLSPWKSSEDYSRIPIDQVKETKNLGSYFNIRSLFMDGLHKVFVHKDGTANAVYKHLNAYPVNEKESCWVADAKTGGHKKLYIYGKTGTIDGHDEYEEGSLEDHLLAVVITDTCMEKARKEEDFRTMKFYVIYIADFASVHWGRRNAADSYYDAASDAEIINQVMKSNEFKNYMGIK